MPGRAGAHHGPDVNMSNDTVGAVYELREAAVEHGKALAELERVGDTPAVRDHVLETTLELETKTVAALDECSENAETAAETAVAAGR